MALLARRAAPRPPRTECRRALRVSRCVDDWLAQPRPPARGSVHSVFPRAANVQLDGSLLLSLSAPEVPLAANGVAVELGPADTFFGLGLHAGQTLIASPESLRIHGRLAIDLAHATPWEPRPAIQPGLPARELAERTELLRRLVGARAPSAGLAPILWPAPILWTLAGGVAPPPSNPFASAALPAARALALAAASLDPTAAAAAAAGLAGLGPGLTPSGDDLLAGFLATWHHAWTALGQLDGRPALVADSVLASALPRASTLGRCWLEHARSGEVSEAQARLLSALLSPGESALAPEATAVMSHGATSGADWLVGVVLAGRAVARSETLACQR